MANPKKAARDAKRPLRRVEVKIHVIFQSVEELRSEHARNLAKGEIFLKTDRLIDPNAEIDLTLTLPDGHGEFHVQGKVVRLMSISHPTKPGTHLYGLGIAALAPPPELKEAMEKILLSMPPQ